MATTQPAAQEAMRAGLALARAGQIAQAAEAFRQATQIDSAWAAAHNNLGNALRLTDQLEAAVASYRRAVELGGEASAPRNLVGALLTLDRPAEAIPILEQLVAAAPGDHESQQMLTMLRSGGGTAPAEPSLDDILAHGLTAQQAGKLSEAERAYRFVLSRQPQHARGLALLATLARQAGAHTDSIELLRQAVSAEPAEPAWQLELGNSLEAAGRLDEALATLDQLVALAPDSAPAHNNRGKILLATGRPAEAETAYRRCLALDSNLEIVLRNLAQVQLFQRKFDEAAESCQQYLARVPDDRTMQYMRAFLTGEPLETMPAECVQRLFDPYADWFDSHLTSLQYAVPQQMREAIDRLVPREMRDWLIIDLGCGTGLCGAEFSSRARRMVGSDLAPRMVEKARTRGIYHDLRVEDVHDTLAPFQQTVDLIVAGDVLIYVGSLSRLFPLACQALRIGGRMVFSTELGAGQDYTIVRSGRFQHSEPYIRREAERAGLHVEQCQGIVVRQDGTQPIPGQLYVLQRLP